MTKISLWWIFVCLCSCVMASEEELLIRKPRSILGLGDVLSCAFDLTHFQVANRYNCYGCYCGLLLGMKTPPVDSIDNCCRKHNECYDRLNAAGTCTSWYGQVYLTHYTMTCSPGPTSNRTRMLGKDNKPIVVTTAWTDDNSTSNDSALLAQVFKNATLDSPHRSARAIRKKRDSHIINTPICDAGNSGCGAGACKCDVDFANCMAPYEYILRRKCHVYKMCLGWDWIGFIGTPGPNGTDIEI